MCVVLLLGYMLRYPGDALTPTLGQVWDAETGKISVQYSSPRNIVTCMLWSDPAVASIANGGDMILQVVL